MTRKDYMNHQVTHRQYYASVAQLAGIDYSASYLLPRIKVALASGDEHLNTIPLAVWDIAAIQSQHVLTRSLREHGDSFSLGGGVCAHKEAARLAAELTR